MLSDHNATKSALLPLLFYFIGGAILLVCFSVLINTYVLHLKVTTAVVSAPIETMHAPLSGMIKTVYVTEGQPVKPGDPLLTIENFDLEQKARIAKINIAAAESNLAYYHHLLDNEQKRLTLYKKIGHNRVVSAQATADISQKKLRIAHSKLKRLTPLLKQHYISQAVWEAQEGQYKSAQQAVTQAQAIEHIEHQALRAIDQGLYFTGGKTEGRERDLLAKLHAAEEQVHFNKLRAKVYQQLIKKLTLRAPFNAKIMQILKSVGNTTNNNNPLLLLENTQIKKTLIAYLTQQEVQQLKAANKATIYIPATGTTYRGKITEINRTQGFIDEINRQFRWRDLQTDRSAKVMVALDPRDQAAFNQQTFAGMPAIVYFTKLHRWF